MSKPKMSETRPGRYRHLPTEVTAIRWTGVNHAAVDDFAGRKPDGAPVVIKSGQQLRLWIEKSQTTGTVNVGDWVLAEQDGVGFYPCTAERFAEDYQPADD